MLINASISNYRNYEFSCRVNGHGFGTSKMSRAQTFPSYAPEHSEEAQQPLSRSSSYGFSYSSSLIQ
ncbi:hypothetical protein H8959_015148 [Pygathrix nigripes]